MSNQRAKGELRPYVKTSRQYGFSILAAMWLGTMSSTSPKPNFRKSATNPTKSLMFPTLGLMVRGSTTS